MTSKVPKHFGPLVRRVRESKDIGLREFAKMVGISPTYVSKFERAEMAPPSVETIVKMAEILDLDADELLGRAAKIPPDIGALLKQRPDEFVGLLRVASELTRTELSVLLAHPLLQERRRPSRECSPLPVDDELPIGA
jgi:transcriptional regulator with XRE-family HTH domain